MFKLRHGFLGAQQLLVAVVGVGGTGSEIVSLLINLHLGLIARGYGGLHVVAFDPDTVSPSNIVRQRYSPADIGLPKARVLISRVNLCYGLDWEAIDKKFSGAYAKHGWDLVISCVDTRRARAELHRDAFRERFGVWQFWLDLGNDRTTGQAILGTPRGAERKLLHSLPCATELHPELMDTSIPEDAPSCSAAESLNRQDLMVNKAVAMFGIDLLWRLFRDGKITSHACYFDLATSSLSGRPVPVKAKRRRTAA